MAQYTKAETRILLQGLELYKTQVAAMHTKAMKLKVDELARGFKKELDAITDLENTLGGGTL